MILDRLLKHYRDNKIAFHTYLNPPSKHFSVVIKNVPPSLTQEDIEELQQFSVLIIKQARLLKRIRHRCGFVRSIL